MTEFFYRLVDRRVGDEYHSEVQVTFDAYPVIRRTARGTWIGRPSSKRFVLDGEGKRFAHPTKDAALKGFLARKKRQVRILSSRLQDVEEAVLLAKAGRFDQGYDDVPVGELGVLLS